MKKYLLIYLFIITSFSVEAQYSLRASMGIDFANTPSLNDYINQTFPVGGSPLNDFNTAINFSGEFGYSFSNTFHLGLEIGYLLNSYNFSNDRGKFEFDYSFISPSLLGYYVVNGSGYNFKFGGGAGIRFVSVDLTFPPTNFKNTYKSTGFGLILRADGNTLLGGNFYANIGADLKYDLIPSPQSGSVKLYNSISREEVNLNSVSFGVRLGVSYIL